jgi:ABC-type polysaccharide/polyol phosphate transport system ATPase subunit
MVSLRVENLSLVYRLRRRPTLRRRSQVAVAGGDQRIVANGQKRSVVALSGVDFELKAGDRLGLVGPNGSGKTTLLKVLFGVFEPTSGAVHVDGRVDALFNVSLGFRHEATGRRNIVLRGLINGWSERQIDERIDEIIEFSELGDFIDLPLKAYSQGMATRLAFAVATSLDPEILLMDEWIGAGDTSFQAKAKQRMSDLAEKAGIIVLASHNHGLIQRNCNKVLQLKYGHVERFYDNIAEFAADQNA